MRFWNTDDYDVGEFLTYQEALAAYVRRNKGRYASLRESERPVPVNAPPPEPLTPKGYDHYMATVLGDGMYGRLASVNVPLPDSITVSCYDPTAKPNDPNAQRVVLRPRTRTVTPSGLKTGGQIVEIDCIGRFLGEVKFHTIRLSLYTDYVKIAIVRDDIHRRSYRHAA
jgi:hypothetical protein